MANGRPGRQGWLHIRLCGFVRERDASPGPPAAAEDAVGATKRSQKHRFGGLI